MELEQLLQAESALEGNSKLSTTVASGIAYLLVANSEYSDYKDLASVDMKANEIAEKQMKYRSLLLRLLYTLDYAHGS